ncbi:MAG: response regulator [bacterium]
MEEATRILIVDDNADIRATMSLILKFQGYNVSTACNGREAIERVSEQPFDVTFMDIKMPVMDGVESFKRIHEMKPDAVVVMMTAYAVEDLVQEARLKGAYGIVYKPVDMERLIELIESVKNKKADKM